MNDLISRQAAIDLFPNDSLEWDTNDGYIAPHLARRMIEELPSAQPEDWMGRNKDRILQAGKEGREVEFRIGGRLFAIREKAQ